MEKRKTVPSFIAYDEHYDVSYDLELIRQLSEKFDEELGCGLKEEKQKQKVIACKYLKWKIYEFYSPSTNRYYRCLYAGLDSVPFFNRIHISAIPYEEDYPLPLE